jgi:hypothetical protein
MTFLKEGTKVSSPRTPEEEKKDFLEAQSKNKSFVVSLF